MSGGVLLFLLIVVVAVAVFGLPLAGFSFLPPWNAATVVRISAGKITMKRGQLRGQIRDDLKEVLSDAGVTSGFIAITEPNRVHFSRNIPEALRQRLRNVLLN